VAFTLPALAGPRLRQRASSVGVWIAAAAGRLLCPVKPVLRNLASIPFTVAGWACIDVGVFQAGTVAGFIVTGVTLMVLEHQIADQP
jgi:hypothetical protein